MPDATPSNRLSVPPFLQNSHSTRRITGIKEYSDWLTIPQLCVKGEFLGGSDIMMEMYVAGELHDLVAEHGLAKAE